MGAMRHFDTIIGPLESIEKEFSKVKKLINWTQALLTEKMGNTTVKSDKVSCVERFKTELSNITTSTKDPAQALSLYIEQLKSFEVEIANIANQNIVLKGSRWKRLFSGGEFNGILPALEQRLEVLSEKVEVVNGLQNTIEKCKKAVLPAEALLAEINTVLGITSIIKDVRELHNNLEQQDAKDSGRLRWTVTKASDKNNVIHSVPQFL